MVALGKIYVDALEDKYGLARGWFANWPPLTPVQLGQVGSLQTNHETGITSLRPGATLNDYHIPFSEEDGRSASGTINLTTGNETSLTFGLSASTPGFKWIGDAKAGFKAKFGESGGMQAELADLRRKQISNQNGLRDLLLAAAESGSLPRRSAIVVEMDVADRGMIVASTTAAADLKVSTDVDLKPAQVKLSSFAGSFAIKSNSGSAVVQPMATSFPAAFRTLVIGQRGIWWWKRFVILGAATMTDSDLVDLMEDGLEDADYFATY